VFDIKPILGKTIVRALGERAGSRTAEAVWRRWNARAVGKIDMLSRLHAGLSMALVDLVSGVEWWLSLVRCAYVFWWKQRYAHRVRMLLQIVTRHLEQL
jgi:hypothetical protein